MANSTRRARSRHSAALKPHPDFPLTAHPTGRWCKKVKGKLYYFGRIDDPQAALEDWNRRKDGILAGHDPAKQKDAGEAELVELCNRFMTAKKALVDSGELTLRSWIEYDATCKRLLEVFGRTKPIAQIGPDEFERLRTKLPATWGLVRRGNEIQRVRTVFRYAWAIRKALKLTEPNDFGPSFVKPSQKALKKLRNKTRTEDGLRMFEAAELRLMLEKADTKLRAMILLGVNAALGNEDIGRLHLSAINLDAGWIAFPRPKTGAERRCKLWPETIAALRAVLAERKPPADAAVAHLVFLTKYGKAWTHEKYGATAVTHELDKFLKTLNLKRPGLSFYGLRHTFSTIADGRKDRRAADIIMGHSDPSMAARHYIERIDDSRLEAISAHVRDWLFAAPSSRENAVPKETVQA